MNGRRSAWRRVALSVHVATSVGWLGAVVVMLALALTGLTGDETRTVRAAYIAMDVLAWTVLIPLAVAALITGVAQGLISPWGLFRHYWVTFKLGITLVATLVLVAYTGTLDGLAGVADGPPAGADGLAGLRSPSPVVHAAAGLLLLSVATALSVFKPRGLTRHGWRVQRRRVGQSSAQPQPGRRGREGPGPTA